MPEWTGSQVAREGSGYENGSQHLEEYSSHSVYSNNDVEDLGVLANPALINESYVRDGHLIRSVSNPKTYITRTMVIGLRFQMIRILMNRHF